MKPAAPPGSVMYGRRTTNGTSDSDSARANNHNSHNHIPQAKNKFATDAEEQWYAMMQSKTHADNAFAAQEKHIEAPKQKVIQSPHTATHFRVPGARGYSMVPHAVVGVGAGKGGKGKGVPPSIMRVARANPVGREVNSKTDAKPVPGQTNPLGLVKRPGAKPPPPMHPSMIMRKTNGMVTTGGARPPPPNMRKGLTPGRGPMPRGHGPARGPPPDPMALARLRARGPPNQVRMRPSPQKPVQITQPTKVVASETHNNRPSRLAQGGLDVLASSSSRAPPPTVTEVNGSVSVVDEDATIDSIDQEIVEQEADHGWIQMWDEEVESNYYYNQLTGEASWIRPEEVAEDVFGGDSVVSSLGGASIIDESWDRYWDDEAAAYYLHNATTGETKWENDHVSLDASYEADTKF